MRAPPYNSALIPHFKTLWTSNSARNLSRRKIRLPFPDVFNNMSIDKLRMHVPGKNNISRYSTPYDIKFNAVKRGPKTRFFHSGIQWVTWQLDQGHDMQDYSEFIFIEESLWDGIYMMMKLRKFRCLLHARHLHSKYVPVPLSMQQYLEFGKYLFNQYLIIMITQLVETLYLGR